MKSKKINDALRGASAHVRGVQLLCTHPRLLLYCMPCTLLTVTSAAAATMALWLPLFFLRLWPLRVVVKFEALLHVSSLVVLNTAQAFWPSLSGRVFFAAYSAVGGDASALQQKKVLRGLLAQLLELVAQGLAGLGVLIFAVATAGVWAPVLLASVAAASVAGWAAAVALLSPVLLALLLLVLCGGGGLIARRLAPALAQIRRLSSASLVLGVAVLLLALAGLIPRAALDALAELASAYLLSLAHAKQLLAQYGIRLSAAGWRHWHSSRHWALVGFGLPLVLVFRWAHPLLSLVLLEVTHAAAGSLLHELGAEEEEEKAAP